MARQSRVWPLFVLSGLVLCCTDASHPLFQIEPRIQVDGVWDFTFDGAWHDCAALQPNGPIAPIDGIVLQQMRFDVIGESRSGTVVSFTGRIEGDQLVGTFQTCLQGACPLGVPCLNQFVRMTKTSPSRLTGSHNGAGINCVGCLADGAVTGVQR